MSVHTGAEEETEQMGDVLRLSFLAAEGSNSGVVKPGTTQRSPVTPNHPHPSRVASVVGRGWWGMSGEREYL